MKTTRREVRRVGVPLMALLALAVAAPGVPSEVARVPSQQRSGSGLIDAASLTAQDLSPGFLGLYRKVMVIEDRIRGHATTYGLDYDLARAVGLP